MFKKIGDKIAETDNLASFEPREVSNSVWAYASANVINPILFEKLSDVIIKKDDLTILLVT